MRQPEAPTRGDPASGARRALLAWYDRARRELPWRAVRDPYRVWLSEVMLQQTRVDVALPYFERFTARFPDVESLAAAAEDEVLALWSGLGYYRRARQLHAAARRIVERGGFPRTVAGWQELPGVGAYTAAAVGSICFGEAVPVLDGNVARVVSRLLALADTVGAAVRRRLLAAAAELVDPARPGDSNQALMELGATLCTPRRPSCPGCPLLPGCRAAAAGEAERFPAPRARRAAEPRRLLAAVAETAGRVLLVRRPDGASLLAGTWEVPWVEAGGSGEDARAAAAVLLAERYGGRWRLSPERARVRHTVTFRALEVAVHRAEVEAGGEVAEGVEAGWFDAASRLRLPLSSLVGKVLAAAGRRSAG